MSISSTIISVFQVSGMGCGAIVGYAMADQAMQACMNSPLKRHYVSTIKPHVVKSRISERIFFGSISGLSMCMVGYWAFPLTIPIGVIMIKNYISK